MSEYDDYDSEDFNETFEKSKKDGTLKVVNADGTFQVSLLTNRKKQAYKYHEILLQYFMLLVSLFLVIGVENMDTRHYPKLEIIKSWPSI